VETAAIRATEEIRWLGMRLIVPADWEIVRHSVRPEKGRLVLVDRRRQRLQLSWVRTAAPAVDRALADYRSLDLAENPARTFSPGPSVGRWRGFRRHDGQAVLTRAGQYDPRVQRWIEIAVEWPDGLDADGEQAILESFTAFADEPNRWRAFSLDVRTPPTWTLEQADVKPADAALTFREGARSARVRRLGACDAWYDGNLESFLRKEAVGGAKAATSPRQHNGHPACLGESRLTRSRLGEWLGLGRPRRDLVWRCPEADALFHVTTDASGPAVPPERFVVRCCGREGGER
jgi:hypothetical protein